MKSNNRIVLYVLVGFAVLAVVWTLIRNNDLQKNGIILNGRVLKDAFATKSSVMEFKYQFIYKDKAYEDYSPAGVTNSSAFIGKTFPIRFSPETGRSEILITPRHFERYDIPYPDSLEWVKKYEIKTFSFFHR
jgi:hypothetical protein